MNHYTLGSLSDYSIATQRHGWGVFPPSPLAMLCKQRYQICDEEHGVHFLTENKE